MATITRTIAQGSDDAYLGAYDSKPYGINDTTIVTNVDSGDTQYIIGRFSNITIPKDTIITSAYLKFTVSATAVPLYTTNPFPPDPQPCTGFYYTNKEADDIATFVNGGGAIVETIKVNQIVSTSVVANTEYTSSNLKTIIQNIVNRGGWISGNAIAIGMGTLPLFPYSSDDVTIHSYDGDPAKAMKLEITYEEPPIKKGNLLLFF